VGSERKRFIISCAMPMGGCGAGILCPPYEPRSPNGAHDMGIETMKKFLLGTVGLVAFGMAAPATATGFYIGANGGWGSSDSCVDFLDVTGVQCR
jgi:hypothetical protein